MTPVPRAQLVVANDWQLWTQPIAEEEQTKPYGQGDPRVVCVANLKGGVAKTTVTANFAAYLARERGKKVLLIDFDYQGSLSQMVLRAAGVAEDSSRVEKLLDTSYSDSDALHFSLPVNAALPSGSLYTAAYGFDSFESRLQFEWMRGEHAGDLRLRLRNRLQSEAFRNGGQAYDIVLIDTGPRWTTSSINALSAADYVLVPTVLDSLSALATGRFLLRLNSLKRAINPDLQLLGVVGTLTRQSSLQDGERSILLRSLPEYLQGAGHDPNLISKAFMPRRNAIADQSSANIAYNVIPSERPMFRSLFEPLAARLFG